MAQTDNPFYFRPSVLIVNLPRLTPSCFLNSMFPKRKVIQFLCTMFLTMNVPRDSNYLRGLIVSTSNLEIYGDIYGLQEK